MSLALDYPYVEAWCLGRNNPGDVQESLAQARADKAPSDAFTKKTDGTWAVMSKEISDRSDIRGLTPEQLAAGQFNGKKVI